MVATNKCAIALSRKKTMTIYARLISNILWLADTKTGLSNVDDASSVRWLTVTAHIPRLGSLKMKTARACNACSPAIIRLNLTKLLVVILLLIVKSRNYYDFLEELPSILTILYMQ